MFKYLIYSTLFVIISAKSIKKEKFIDTAQILFDNPKICGNPFSDPVWIPVLDLCNEKCDPIAEYCVENEELVQQCKSLPEECQNLIRKYNDPDILNRSEYKADKAA